MVLKVNNLSLPMKWTPIGPLLSIKDKVLQPIEWIINAAAIGEVTEFAEVLARGEDASTEGFFAVPLALDDIEAKDRALWRELTGEELGEDVYMVGTIFTHEVVLPRQTLLQIVQTLEKKRAEFPEPPFPWLFRLDPYFFSPAEGEREFMKELEERAVAFVCIEQKEADEVVEESRQALLRDLEAAGIFSEAYSEQKRKWLDEWGCYKLLTYHKDAMRFLYHFRRRGKTRLAQERSPVLGVSVLGRTLQVPQWR